MLFLTSLWSIRRPRLTGSPAHSPRFAFHDQCVEQRLQVRQALYFPEQCQT